MKTLSPGQRYLLERGIAINQYDYEDYETFERCNPKAIETMCEIFEQMYGSEIAKKKFSREWWRDVLDGLSNIKQKDNYIDPDKYRLVQSFVAGKRIELASCLGGTIIDNDKDYRDFSASVSSYVVLEHVKYEEVTVKVPQPEREAPAIGTTYYVPTLLGSYNIRRWENSYKDNVYLQGGLVYMEMETATERAKVMKKVK